METRTRMIYRCMGDPFDVDDVCTNDIGTVLLTTVLGGDDEPMMVLVPACSEHTILVAAWLEDMAIDDGWATSPEVLEDDELMEELRETVGIPIVTHGRSTF